jgi:hypothetical protein
MKEQGQNIILDKAENRKIPASEQTIRPDFKKPDENLFNNINHAERVRKMRLHFTRKQISEMPILALIVPLQEVPEKLPDFTPRNGFLEFLEAIFGIFADVGKAMFSKDGWGKK